MKGLSASRVVQGCLALALVSTAAIVQHNRYFERVWFQIEQTENSGGPDRLPSYQVDIEGRAIGEETNVSALSFDPERNTLVSVTNQRPHFLELSLDGELLRSIPLQGFKDPEAIEYISPGVYIIVEERRRRLTEVHINDATTLIDIDDPANAHQLDLSSVGEENKGFEGLAFDAANQRLFIAKERDPMRIFEVSGFMQHGPGPLRLQVRTDPERDQRLFLTDLSSLYYDSATQHLWALSDESKMVIELDQNGQPLSSLNLRAGNLGLKADIPQAEGMAMGSNGDLYLVSEPNLFYRFKRTVE
ncbi:SdiA-regulated domain-containing protein [Pseudomonas sp. GV071]|uniref:SdiA-regulated domain-containing protein n=1 Tax=Pseudomonas sp. GV071 TaxID=2135754 RepID=UPI000D377FBE|nr:SdiA-regulated domain-containing protein [Pseudomonas sp. GV071]PTQ73186.1 uncharacterized protein YjiK [Pseudomonas sp. GV071]